MIEKVTLNEAMSALQAGTSVNNIIGLSGNEGRKITPSNLLSTMGTSSLVKRMQIPRKSNSEWTRVLEIPGDSSCIFSLETSSYVNTYSIFIIGAVSISVGNPIVQFSNLLDLPRQDQYTPSIRYKNVSGRFVLWAKSPTILSEGYVSVWSGSPRCPMTLETPPDDALKPGFITT